MEALRKAIEEAANTEEPYDVEGYRAGYFDATVNLGQDLLPLLQQAEEEHEHYKEAYAGAMVKAFEYQAELAALREAVKNYLMIKSGWSAAYDSTQDVYNAYLEQIAQAEQALREAVGV